MNLLILFVVLNVVNVILQTAKSIATLRCGKTVAALANAIAYGLYTVVIIYTNCELPLVAKVAVVAVTNLIGVYVVKWVEEKLNKEKLWKVEATVPQYLAEDLHSGRRPLLPSPLCPRQTLLTPMNPTGWTTSADGTASSSRLPQHPAQAPRQ